METLLESADVARALDLTPASVRALAGRGRLPIAAITPRGARLFRLEDVEAARRARDSASGQPAMRTEAAS